MKWISVQPLIGGMSIGAKNILGTYPEGFWSPNGIGNDIHIRKYWSNISYNIIGRDKLNFKPDIIIGVPVCSALSSLNQKSSSDYCSIDNIYQLSEFSLETKPKVAIFENAPGLFSKKGKPVREKLYNISKKFGYKLSILNTDTRLHGIPQRRIRTYFIFWKENGVPIIEWERNNHPSLEDYLDNIPKEASLQDQYSTPLKNYIENPYINYLKFLYSDDWKRVIQSSSKKTILSYIVKYGSLKDLQNWLKNNNYEEKVVDKIRYIRSKLDKGLNFWDPSPHISDKEWINAVQGRVFLHSIHPTRDRWINIREWMHLMGLPHDFQIQDQKYHHITQNVPTKTTSWVIRGVKNWLDGKLKIMNTDFLLQDNIKRKISGVKNSDINIFF